MKRYTKETWVGIFMTVGTVCVVYLALQLGDLSLLDKGSYSLKARFFSISSLREGSPVTMMGIRIGEVRGVGIDQQRGQAVVRFRVDEEIEIYNDAIASIKTQGLIGDKYMEIDPGGAGERLRAGDTIVDTQSAVDLTEMIGRYAFGSVESQ
ncbi:MAG: outer membrane lipid asymmetry maintenance protein MlaD [Desulfobacterales bacterium]